MKNNWRNLMTRFLLLAGLILNLVACGTSAKTNFYVLSTERVEPDELTSELGIGLWKVTLPVLLNRPEIVTREGKNKVAYADFHQWAGGLDNNITISIGRELTRRLKTDRLSISPWRAHKINDYQVKVYLYRFDGELGGDVVAKGTWNLLNGKGDKELRREAFSYTAKTSGKEHVDMVAALGELTTQLSATIAEAIESDRK
jgi:uncharacterized lipoprotein YmbA